MPVDPTDINDIYQDKYEKFSEEDKSFLHQLFFDPSTREEIKTKLKHIIFKIIPPTPEEFLDPAKGYLPEPYIHDLYPYIKSDFIAAMNTENPYGIICSYGSTRIGKTVLARLFCIYVIIYCSYLRDPHYYYSISQMSKLCLYLVSFVESKTKQILLDPILQILDASDKFKRERFELNVKKKGVTSNGIIHFSEASKFGSITFPKLHIVCGKDASSLVGADIICGIISELTFFKEYAPTALTDEDILRIFNKLHTRIQNTVGRGSFPSFTYLDSSANIAESPLEKMILNEFQYDHKVFFRWYTLWKVRSHLFPIYHADNSKTFKVCTGNGDTPSKIITNESDLELLPKNLIIDVPIDLRKEFERGLIDQIKDTAGYPTASESRFIQDISIIEKIFDNSILKNIEGALIANSEDFPDYLLWNKIKHLFYSQYDGHNFIISRAQQEPRFFCMDNSFASKGDALGVCCLHKELRQSDNQIMYICDFNFVLISSKGQEINLEAFPQLIINMMVLGQTHIKIVGSDSFQSKPLLQHLERNKIQAITQSVDRDIAPYQFFLTTLLNGVFKEGRNVFFKNNLYSLYRTLRTSGSAKIDHSYGDRNNLYDGNFKTSTAGVNAKDASDAACGAVWLAHSDESYPQTIYEIENQRFSTKKIDIENNIKEAYKRLHRTF